MPSDLLSNLLSNRLVNFRERHGQVPLRTNGAPVREDATPYQFTRRGSTDSVGTQGAGLSVQDALAQVRADLSMMEGGNQADKRRAWNFLRDVHLPLLARCLKLE